MVRLKSIIKFIVPIIVILTIYLLPFYLLRSEFSSYNAFIYNSTKNIPIFNGETYLSIFQGILTFSTVVFGFYTVILLFVLEKLVKKVNIKIKNNLGSTNSPFLELIIPLCVASLIILALMFPLGLLFGSVEFSLIGMGNYGLVYGQLYSVNNTSHQLVISETYPTLNTGWKPLLSEDINSAVSYAFNASLIIFVYIFLYIYYSVLLDDK